MNEIPRLRLRPRLRSRLLILDALVVLFTHLSHPPVAVVSAAGDSSEADLCRLFQDNTKLRKPGTCEEFITCQNSTMVVSSCAEGKLFDKSKSSCVDAQLLASDDYCAPRCDGRDGEWVADLTSCRGFYYCSDGVARHGYCPVSYHFNETDQMCIFETTSLCIDDVDVCQLVPDGVKFRDETTCSSYKECKNGVLLTIKCNKSGHAKYFDVETGECVDRYQVRCDAHPVPDEVCGTDGKAKSGVFVSDQATCRGYFYCKDLGYVADLEPSWGQCPEGTFFNSETSTCDDPKMVVCSHDRCDGRGTRLVESPDCDCHSYWVCVDGVRVEQRQCVGDRFFDTTLEACVHTIIDYPSCDYYSLNPNAGNKTFDNCL